MNSVSRPTRRVIWEAYAALSLWAWSKKSANCFIRELGDNPALTTRGKRCRNGASMLVEGDTTHLFWIEILEPVPRDMFGEAVHFETLADGFENDIFEGSLGVPAELTGM